MIPTLIDLIYYQHDIFDNEQGIEELLAKLPFETIDPRAGTFR
jgi:hypothetical protein